MHLIYLGDKVRGAGEDAVWLLRERVAWPVEDAIEPVEPRALIGVFGGGGIAVAGVVAALLISSPGSGAGGGTTAAPAGAGLARATATAPAPP
ncbi:MAG TPA: hypothetical protein VHE08_02800, partial [Solirubrobacterales bacterium]|nr:hypothetical protein [Solirubrobacterales bacterium]